MCYGDYVKLVRKPLVLPVVIAQKIDDAAARAGRRPAWPIEEAWDRARSRIADLAPPLDPAAPAHANESDDLAPHRIRQWLLEERLAEEIDREAARLDCSATTVVLQALVLAGRA
jgi:hypothetical protein